MWRVIYHIVRPNPQPLRFDPTKLTFFFASTAERTLQFEEDTSDYLDGMNNEIPESNGTIFSLGEVSRCDVLQSLKSLRSDCSTVGVPGEKSLGVTERTNNILNPRMA